MKVAALKNPGGLENLLIEEREDPTPGPGEILVRVHASQLNYHDLAVVLGWMPSADGRIPMSDGAGEVVAVGDGATKFKKGDKVLSLNPISIRFPGEAHALKLNLCGFLI